MIGRAVITSSTLLKAAIKELENLIKAIQRLYLFKTIG